MLSCLWRCEERERESERARERESERARERERERAREREGERVRDRKRGRKKSKKERANPSHMDTKLLTIARGRPNDDVGFAGGRKKSFFSTVFRHPNEAAPFMTK